MRTLLAILFTALLPTWALAHVESGEDECGEMRWDIKTASDRSFPILCTDSTIVYTSVTNLIHYARPSVDSFDSFSSERFRPIETTRWRIVCTILGYKREDDHDYHLAVCEPSDTTMQMICELTDPSCTQVRRWSYLRDQITQARADGDRLLLPHATGSWHNPPLPNLYEITGYGFYDNDHGQTGASPNQVELHPVIAFRSLTGIGESPSGVARDASVRAWARPGGLTVRVRRTARITVYDLGGRALTAVDVRPSTGAEIALAPGVYLWRGNGVGGRVVVLD